jgi:CRP-like cAMP-binding protein
MLLDNRRPTFYYPPIPANDLFSGLLESGRTSLMSTMKSQHFEPNQQVFAAGDKPIASYWLHRGRADLVYAKQHLMSSPECPVGPDQIFGITEILSGHDFEMSLRTVSACDFGVMKREDLVVFLHEQPDVCYRLAAMIGSLYSEVVRIMKMR